MRKVAQSKDFDAAMKGLNKEFRKEEKLSEKFAAASTETDEKTAAASSTETHAKTAAEGDGKSIDGASADPKLDCTKAVDERIFHNVSNTIHSVAVLWQDFCIRAQFVDSLLFL